MSRALARAAVATAVVLLALPLLPGPAGATTPAPTPGLRAGVAVQGGLLVVVYRRTDGRIVLRQQSDGPYDAVDAGGNLVGAPAVVSLSSGSVDLAGIGTDGAVWTRHGDFPDGWDWDPWTSRGGKATGSPALGCSLLEGPVIYVRGTDGALWRRPLNGGWTSLGGSLASSPSVASVGSGCPPSEDVVALGADKAVWERRAGAWTRVGGRSNHAPTLVRLANGWSYLYVVGTDGRLYQSFRVGDAGTWEPFMKKGAGLLSSPPAATGWTDVNSGGPITVLGLGTNGRLYRTSTNDDGPFAFVPFG